MKLTIAQARERLAASTLSPAVRRELEGQVEATIARAVEGQRRLHEGETHDLRQRLKVIGKGLAAVAEDFEELEDTADSSDITARDYHAFFEELEGRRRDLLRKAEDVGQQIEEFERRDDDIEGYLDEMYGKYPSLKPNFPF